MKELWINLYAQGWYHRIGKPGTMNAHPGDLYASKAAAMVDIDPNAPYIATVACYVPDDVHGLKVYGADATPQPLSTTRNMILAGELDMPYHRPAGHPKRGAQLPSYGQADSLEQADA